MMRRRTPHGPLRRLRQSGNVLFTVFALLAGAGVIGATTTAILRGPVANTAKLSKQQIAATAMDAAARLVGSPHGPTNDCDSDGSLEPVAWQAPAGSAPMPSGGGLLPSTLGAAKADPWGSAYGYCVWDHGTQSVSDNVAGCGGSGANRLQGADTKTEPVIAIISAGPDRVFQTSCAAWLDANADGAPDSPLVVRVSGSDDIIHTESLETLLKAGGSAQLPELPDDACTPETIGLMRFEMDTVQICTEDGWEEPGTAVTADGTFAPTNGVELSTTHTTSNTITFSGYFGTRTASVDNGGAIIVNGVHQGASAQIAAGDTVALRGAASATPATPVVYTLTISAVQRPWVLTTRNPTPVNLTIQPTTQNTMNVTGPGNPAFGATVSFLVRNTGETPTTLIASLLSNTAHFSFATGGSDVGDDCAGKTLGLNQTCVIDVRPRASDDGTYNGTLTARDGVRTAQSDLSGTATGWMCTVAANTTWTVAGKTCTVPTALTIASGSSAVATDSTQPTTGTATYSCSGGTATVAASTCVERCTVAAGATWAVSGKTCTAPTALTINHGATAVATDATQPTTGTATYSCNNGTASVTTSSCVEQCSVASGTTWTVSGKTCTVPTALTIANGASATSTDSTAPTTGSATYSCANGTTSITSSSCAESCTANQTVSWSPGCSAPSGAVLANGANRTITNTASGYNGTRTITCNNGTLTQSGGSCASAAPCSSWQKKRRCTGMDMWDGPLVLTSHNMVTARAACAAWCSAQSATCCTYHCAQMADIPDPNGTCPGYGMCSARGSLPLYDAGYNNEYASGCP
ncbi:hypothetical protein [Hyphomicrobium sp.]|uniref:hypothetical protein n=1 Tax=Hyphomicrobium sp. TaxID=82 RepID=UPI002FDFCC10